MQANKAQLSATVATQVEAARAGMALLDKAHKTLANMQNSYKVSWSHPPCTQTFVAYHKVSSWTKVFDMLQMIDKLCTECSALIENHEKIQILSAVHYNLGKTLQVGLHFEELHVVVSASTDINSNILRKLLVLLSSAPSAVA